VLIWEKIFLAILSGVPPNDRAAVYVYVGI